MFIACARRMAFTLIELLIVVAIIAILAAIAVPNFLEAQVRAKVSRAKADMRSMATAIESYSIDYNRYPIVADESGEPILPYPPAGTGPEFFETRVSVALTTPVAYITSRFNEPFPGAEDGENAQYHYGTRAYAEAFGGGLTRRSEAEVEEFEEYVSALFGPQNQTHYFTLSHGPDTDHDIEEHAHRRQHSEEGPTVYDPTNGTVSSGDIVYFGPGIGFPN